MRSLPFAVALLMATPVPADNDPNRPTEMIAADLGLEEAVFTECFKPVNPEPGKHPTDARQRANKAVLLPCLQKSKPAVTNDNLDRVMDKYCPEGASGIRGSSTVSA